MHLTVARSCAAFAAVVAFANATSPVPPVPPEPVAPPAPAPARPARLEGTVPILMYHQIGPEEKYMVRSVENFRRDLNWLYAAGFRPVTLAQYASGDMPVEPGMSPVVLTFDDSHISQYRILPDGRTDPDCFVGVWSDFAQRRADFPVRGTFFVNANGPFQQPDKAKEKIRQLVAWGSEIGWHTMSHPNLGKLGDASVKYQLASGFDYLGRFGVVPESFALPYGVLPRNPALLDGFDWNGRQVRFRSVVLAGSAPAPSPAGRRNLHRLPRILAYPGVLGIDYWLNRYGGGRSEPYVAGVAADG